MAASLMLQGTGSSVGKSLLVAGIGRALRRRGHSVAPFKPQNMSNNAAVAADGGEIGRAQWLQALACGVKPTVDMNPVLLKPEGAGAGAQIVVHGRVRGRAGARAYQAWKPGLMADVRASFARLSAAHDIVLVEGAGSASEINLRENDIANMGFARAERVPVVVVGDIDRGGVIASLVGTRHVLAAEDAALVRGFVVNRMRGDLSLFEDGMRMIVDRTGWLPFGLVPFFADAALLPDEDALDLVATARAPGTRDGRVRVAVPMIPSLANADDLDPLRAEAGVELLLLPLSASLPGDCDLVLLPGSKAVASDLAALRASGWDHDIIAHCRRGGRVLGLCGGYQMLGRAIHDPEGIEGVAGTVPGLGLLAVETVLGRDKRVVVRTGTSRTDGAPLRGYEIHLGRTAGPDAEARPFARFDDGTPDGARSADGLVAGSYVHGLFDEPAQRAAWVGAVAPSDGGSRHADRIDRVLDAFADHLEAHLDMTGLIDMAFTRQPPRS